jgi:hypothetical protein
MNERGFVYSIYNLLRSKEYVGGTGLRTPDLRWNQHIHAAERGSELPIHCALRKYGVSAFKFSVIWEGSLIDVGSKETQFIVERNTLVFNGYNLRSGGEGFITTEETRRLIKLNADRRGVEPLVIFPELEFSNVLAKLKRKGGAQGGKLCLISDVEKNRLIHWGEWPCCKHHRHIKRKEALVGPYQFIQSRDGTRLPMVVRLINVSGWITKEAMSTIPGNVFADHGTHRI